MAIEETRHPRARLSRERIRAAATELFLQRGFAGTSMDAVVAAANVSKPTLYNHYPSKEALFADVLRRLTIENLQAPSLVAAGEVDLASRDDLRRALNALAQEIVANALRPECVALLRVIIAEVPRFPHLGDLVRSTVPERGLEAVAGVLARAHERGLIRLDDPDATARLFMGPLLTYLVIDGLLTGGAAPRPEPARIEAIVALYLNAIS